MSVPMTILGIESSCDDTAAAVVRGVPSNAHVLSNVVFGQTDAHAAFGGVVPEIAARAHAEKIDLAIEGALSQAGLGLDKIDAIAVTAGPGLVGGVLSGVMCAKGLSAATGLPLIGVNHLAGHALTPQLTDGIAFPYVMLLVSGGHCQFLLVQGHDDYTRLGGTIDDAPGEAFDKTARILALPQPGGPSVERHAKAGNDRAFALPRPLLNRDDCNMSFSGLKTAILRARDDVIDQHGGLPSSIRSDLCASFQAAVRDVLVAKSRKAMAAARALTPEIRSFAVAGGVAANGTIRSALEAFCAETDTTFVAPPLSLCTDNAAMIAYAGLIRLQHGQIDDMSLTARPRWPLDQTSPTLSGSGKKGAKS
ncbi:tRNA (adenosine(37)-N6)-threonylcarbamoyltransferase complex transferase subunit TsaD [Octadecabacter sp. G9-8]|uniref:tRNA N6-adenosine threonylcarbamoyltransferase n=1 Tax=Octadecabacter dasysiphoniae TaxID=2909341 RepID=A0ABS9CWR7_9RHOB|nr:tRNA (adenosine(37)-N6)-threonylcarbamoyltransferase complex transferase subunit TsaD [Octadecabacter dasysiphoniae]MCF2871517.1 tRNA (adenosine(37)-N6)-threonylcarbamoyltransferase complex transferase subunit TsaD [Octadecabacter dasysiphoniae]